MSGSSTLSRRYSTMLVAGLAVVVLTCLAFLLPVPYVTMKPGPVFDTLGEFDDKPMFAFDDDVKTYPTEGTLDFTTVSVSRANAKIPLAEAIRAWFDKKTAVVPKTFIYPDEQSAEDSSQEGAAQLASSKDSSEVAALRAAGFEVGEVPTIDSVLDDGAAKGKLLAGDKILAVDGKAMATSQQVVDSISGLSPGKAVQLTVDREGKAMELTIVTKADPDDATKARVGVTLGVEYDFPFTVTNNVGKSIGGPSAGTMFALSIYDRLTPGALTGGLDVAGTGTISSGGEVGPIGGIRQKMAGAAKAGADIFLAPAGNCAEALDGDGFGLTIVKVTTLKDAIGSLEALAKNHDAKVPSCR